MKLTTPRWWYSREPKGTVVRFLLWPLSGLWTLATARRVAKPGIDPGVPVISVGNLTMGGSGKTPVVREVLRLLRDGGVRAHGLSRGHGGSLAGPVQVDPATHTAAEVGDEPLMLAADGPFWIARDRAAGARAATAAGAEALVLDDGHQNPALKKSVSLVVVDGDVREGEWPFGDGKVFPAGPMREPLRAGLARADAVALILPEGLAADPELLEQLAGPPVLIARMGPLQPAPEGPLVGFAGIAKPWRVERSLKAAGADLRDFIPFGDHQNFAAAELEFLRGRAADFGARLIITEKDWMRLPAELRDQVLVWRIGIRFEDEAAVRALLHSGR
ncbi:tetraacyldisaccharide 4'-kinase [Brevundimonas sp. 2R-24]|uniref:Tetraacyldisaccharide 4'-kinase n=1 Tax=Peiella sedimenti TaxID=3061083 RepID=A0ABT8SLD9_9CAUL|nr:tetraacyldisaccharide 4'-kinase [Caulobacteraceae bacterium XZ-24]